MAEHWLRLWHGTVTDPKFRMVARDASRNVTQRHATSQAEIPCHAALSVWLYLLESASQHDDRGSVEGVDVEVLAFTLDMPVDHADAIIEAMRFRGLIDDNRLNGWEKRQPKREDTTAAERQRARRERHAESRDVTQCHAESRDVTTEEKRGEEKRGEDKDIHVPNGTCLSSPATGDDHGSTRVVNVPKAEPVDYQGVVDLYHETLCPPMARCVILSDKRKAHLRQRWRDALPNLDEWAAYFQHIAKSDFLMGRAAPSPGRKPFVADLDWIINSTNFVKIAEGKYHQ